MDGGRGKWLVMIPAALMGAVALAAAKTWKNAGNPGKKQGTESEGKNGYEGINGK